MLCASEVRGNACLEATDGPVKGRLAEGLARIIRECRREALETEARRGFSHVKPTEANAQSVEEAEREKPCRARGSDDVAGIHE
ncbi:MAG TPA: hypothetical protein VK626_04140 [Nitrospiraceae bacterium]|nr:hypothetical protein [Nitrospiraceae bacterium]